jgi:hypothetical protein
MPVVAVLFVAAVASAVEQTFGVLVLLGGGAYVVMRVLPGLQAAGELPSPHDDQINQLEHEVAELQDTLNRDQAELQSLNRQTLSKGDR